MYLVLYIFVYGGKLLNEICTISCFLQVYFTFRTYQARAEDSREIYRLSIKLNIYYFFLFERTTQFLLTLSEKKKLEKFKLRSMCLNASS